jgi:hypothetical protein
MQHNTVISDARISQCWGFKSRLIHSIQKSPEDHGYYRGIPRWVKTPGCEADHSPPSSVELHRPGHSQHECSGFFCVLYRGHARSNGRMTDELERIWKDSVMA